MPRSAATAYVLLLVAQELQEHNGRLKRKLSEPRVVSLGERYAVIRFETGDDGHSIGRTVASDIADLATARQIAFNQSNDMLRLVTRQLELLEDLIEQTEEAGNDTPYRMAKQEGKERSELQRLKLLMTTGPNKKVQPPRPVPRT